MCKNYMKHFYNKFFVQQKFPVIQYVHYYVHVYTCTSIFNVDSSASNLSIHSSPSLDNIDSSDVDMYIPYEMEEKS